MPVFISPNVYARELDFSNFVEGFSPTVLGVVLTAQTGPVNEATLITDVPALFETFGNPNANTLGMYAAAQYLREGNQLFVVRVVGPGANKPEVEVPGGTSAGYVDSTLDGPFAFTASTAPVEEGSAAGDFILTDDTKAYWESGAVPDFTVTGLDLTGTPEAAGELNITLDGGSVVQLGNPAPGHGPAIDFTGTLSGLGLPAYTGTPATDGPLTLPLIQWSLDQAFGAGNITVSWQTDRYRFTSEGEGSSGSVLVAVGTAGVGMNIFAEIGGLGVGSDTVSAGVDGNNRFELNAEDGTSFVGAEILEVAAGTHSASALAALLNAEMSPTLAAEVEFDEWPAASNQLRLKRLNPATEVGTDHDIDVEPSAPLTSSMLATVGMSAGVKAGTDGNNRLRVAVDGGVDQDIFLTVGSVRTVDQVVAELDAAISGASVSKVVTEAGSFIRIESDTLGATATIEIKDVDPAFGADEVMGYPIDVFAGSDLNDPVLKFAERYDGNTNVTVRVSRGTAYSVSPPNFVYKVDILQGELLVSSYDNVRKNATTAAEELELFEKVIGTSSAPIDPYVTVEDLGSLAEPELPSPDFLLSLALAPLGADPSGYTLSTGAAEVVGQVSPEVTGLEIFRSTVTLDITLLAAPGFSDDGVVAQLVDIAEDRQDILALIDPPRGLSVQEVNDWANAEGSYTGSRAALNTSYASLFWPWVQIFDSVNSENRWTAPSGHAAAVIARSDNVGDPWISPAGLNRGQILPAIRLELNVTDGQRDFLQGNLNRVNTFVNFVGEGIFLFSQLTLLRKSSQLSRIPVRRMLSFAKKAVVAASRSLLFEPNDFRSWARFESLVNPFLQDIANRRGLTEFKAVMNERTVPPALRDRYEARGIIFLRPTTTMEKIILDFVLTSQGAQFSELEELLF